MQPKSSVNLNEVENSRKFKTILRGLISQILFNYEFVIKRASVQHEKGSKKKNVFKTRSTISYCSHRS